MLFQGNLYFPDNKTYLVCLGYSHAKVLYNLIHQEETLSQGIYFFAKIGKCSIPYFNESAMDAHKTSHICPA